MVKLHQHSIRWIFSLLALVLFCESCGDDRPVGKRYLVDHYQWTLVNVASEHFDAPPTDLICDTERGAIVEELGGELVHAISTQYCSYVTLAQPSLSAVYEGESYYLRYWNSSLSSPLGGLATIVVSIDGDLIWKEELPIPSSSGLTVYELPVPRDYPAGSNIIYHVDNHGENEYALIELSVE